MSAPWILTDSPPSFYLWPSCILTTQLFSRWSHSLWWFLPSSFCWYFLNLKLSPWYFSGVPDSYIKKCPVNIYTWMPHNHLELKMSKTKLIIFLPETVFHFFNLGWWNQNSPIIRAQNLGILNSSPSTTILNQSPSSATLNSPSHSPPLYHPCLALVESRIIFSVNYYNNFLPSFSASGLTSSTLTPSNFTFHTTSSQIGASVHLADP